MSRHAASPDAPAHRCEQDRPELRHRLHTLRREPVLALAVFASLDAGIVHAAVAPEHRAWWASGTFFAARCWRQPRSAGDLVGQPDHRNALRPAPGRG